MLLRTLLLLALTVCCSAQWDSRVSVHIPFNLHDKDGEEHVRAHYGFTKHQGSISAFVYYVEDPEHHLCEPVDWTKNSTHIAPTLDGPTKELKPPFILMTNIAPESCSPVTQARQAQLMGAAGLVLAHDKCRCEDKACLDKFGPDCKQPRNIPQLVNDGSGGDVSIPSFMLYRTYAASVQEELQTNNQPVLMELTWGLRISGNANKTAAEPLKYHLWSSAHDPILDLETLEHFRTVTTSLKPQANFEPRFSIMDGKRWKCNNQAEAGGPCDHLCSNHGRYCALHAWNLSGHAILVETLRRLCVWKYYGTDNVAIYWDYVIYHKQECRSPHLYNDTACIENGYKKLHFDEKIINQCMSDAGGLDADAENTMLQSQIDLQRQSGVITLPALTISDTYVLDEINSFSLFESVCRHFWTHNITGVPDVCYTCATCPNVIGCLEKGHCVAFEKPKPGKSEHHHKKKRHHGWTVFWFMAVCACAGGGYMYYKRQHIEAYGVAGGGGGGGGVLNGYFSLPGEEG